jgi:hypothetical protein
MNQIEQRLQSIQADLARVVADLELQANDLWDAKLPVTGLLDVQEQVIQAQAQVRHARRVHTEWVHTRT